MCHAEFNRVREHSQSTGVLRMLLLLLADRANANGLCWPGMETIAADMNCSKRNAQRYVGQLRESSEVYVVEGGGRFKSHRYILLCGLTESEAIDRLVTVLEIDRAEAVTVLREKGVNYVTVSPSETVTTSVKRVTVSDGKGDSFGETVTTSAQKGDNSVTRTVIEPSTLEPSPANPHYSFSSPPAPDSGEPDDAKEEEKGEPEKIIRYDPEYENLYALMALCRTRNTESTHGVLVELRQSLQERGMTLTPKIIREFHGWLKDNGRAMSQLTLNYIRDSGDYRAWMAYVDAVARGYDGYSDVHIQS